MARPKPSTFDKKKTVAENRRARFDYAIGDVYEAGIVLTGTEVKSLRFGEGSITESYAEVKNGEVCGAAFARAAQQSKTRDPNLIRWIIHCAFQIASSQFHEDLAEHLPAFETFQSGLELFKRDYRIDHGLHRS